MLLSALCGEAVTTELVLGEEDNSAETKGLEAMEKLAELERKMQDVGLSPTKLVPVEATGKTYQGEL